jgi:hypothetical protein
VADFVIAEAALGTLEAKHSSLLLDRPLGHAPESRKGLCSMTEGDEPWTSFQVSLLMVATMLAVVCSIWLILTALRPYITTNEAQISVQDRVLPRMAAAN